MIARVSCTEDGSVVRINYLAFFVNGELFDKLGYRAMNEFGEKILKG